MYLKRLMFSLRLIFGNRPSLFFLLYGLKKSNRELFVKAETELVVNAFPRCGNTYFYYALKENNPSLKIAHHLHVPALTVQGLKKGKPVAIIVRNPEEAVASLLIRENHITKRQALSLYKQFHKVVLENIESVLVLNFNEVISDFDLVVHKLNNRFDLSLKNFDQSNKLDKDKIFGNIESVDARTNSHKSMNEYTVSRPSNNPLKSAMNYT